MPWVALQNFTVGLVLTCHLTVTGCAARGPRSPAARLGADGLAVKGRDKV